MRDITNMPQKDRVEQFRPHLWNIFIQCRKDAIEAHRETKEYKDILEQFADSEVYKGLDKHKSDQLESVDAYLDMIEPLIIKSKEKREKDGSNLKFKYIVSNILDSWELRNIFNIDYAICRVTKLDLTEDNWKEKVKENFISELDTDILLNQRHWADNEYGFTTPEWVGQKNKEAFDAFIYTMSLSDFHTMEETMKNAFDYAEMVIDKSEDEI
jgi:hypothetical protein